VVVARRGAKKYNERKDEVLKKKDDNDVQKS